MIKNLIIAIIVIAAIYFVLKKIVCRCPKCSSLCIAKWVGKNQKEPVFICSKCKILFDNDKRIIG